MIKYLFQLLIFTLFFTACGNNDHYQELKKWMEPNGKMKVICTLAMIEDLVEKVGGEHIDTLTLLKGDLDPHTYQLVKGDDEKLAYAHLIFYNGLNLEHGPSLREFLASSPKAIGIGNAVQQKYPELILHYNGSLDPHIWMDISLWKETIPYIVEALSNIDPEHIEEYTKNGKALTQTLDSLHTTLLQEAHLIPEDKRYLITSHDAFNYFARAYLATDQEREDGSWQTRFEAPEGLSPDSQLSTSDIQNILNHIQNKNIRVIFPETNVSQASIRKLQDAAKDYGIAITIVPEPLYGDAMGEPGSSGDTYQKMIQHNISTIRKYLNGQH